MTKLYYPADLIDDGVVQYLTIKNKTGMNTKEKVLQACRVEGNIVRLPDVELDRKVYMDVANSLNLIGGKWKGGKIYGFVFDEDPTDLLNQITNGEKRNLKKEFQFFGTPDHLADRLVEVAHIYTGIDILEPSAGRGAILKAISKVLPDQELYYCELMPINRTFLDKLPNTTMICSDFFDHPEDKQYDRIIANPPFSNNQDIDHIRKMYTILRPGGRIVTIASKHWEISSNKKEIYFKKWLDQIGAIVDEVPAGKFKESGTSVATCIIIIDKQQQHE